MSGSGAVHYNLWKSPAWRPVQARGVVVQGIDEHLEPEIRWPWWFAAIVSMLVTLLATAPLWLF
jgi:hypothetical protein